MFVQKYCILRFKCSHFGTSGKMICLLSATTSHANDRCDPLTMHLLPKTKSSKHVSEHQFHCLETHSGKVHYPRLRWRRLVINNGFNIAIVVNTNSCINYNYDHPFGR